MNTPRKTAQKYYGTPIVSKDDDIEKLKSESNSYNPYGYPNNGVGVSSNSYEKTPVGITKTAKHKSNNPIESCRRALFFDDKKTK